MVGPAKQPRLELREANTFVSMMHRHHQPTTAHRFSIGVWDGEKIRGVAIVGRPVARLLNDGWTVEVNRVATDGCPNACSALYGAAWRAARAMGYRRLITYILDSEPGTSVRAAGWVEIGTRGGGNWDRPNLGRIGRNAHPTGLKTLYEAPGAIRGDIRPTIESGDVPPEQANLWDEDAE